MSVIITGGAVLGVSIALCGERQFACLAWPVDRKGEGHESK